MLNGSRNGYRIKLFAVLIGTTAQVIVCEALHLNLVSQTQINCFRTGKISLYYGIMENAEVWHIIMLSGYCVILPSTTVLELMSHAFHTLT